MTWILSSVKPHLVLNLKPYKTAAAMWNYLNTVYKQDNSARRFQLEYEMANFTQGSLSIEEYFSDFQTLWADYSDIVYANVPAVALSTVQAVHATRSNLMNRHLVPSLDACLSELLRRNKGRDMRAVQCFSCKPFGHIARDCPKKFCNYCKKQGHIIAACPIRPERKQGTLIMPPLVPLILLHCLLPR
ncbi:hypothetical protein Patl1_11439 [Pistacia atlantica]|uniref:Uncharacterized protein n=1 Tax=Pistacia atlantica TaxID=434234 RepID=A0ACC1A878_9ROSI|nr:hypothetical protein Patl1_11439 [Pistacia atlantica]